MEWARANGAVERFLPHFEEGFTGIVATMDTKRPGPTLAFRVDMDALPILESDTEQHTPMKLNFRSTAEGSMHACGHDAHTSIGLGLATLLAEKNEELNGVIKLIFQPAEEGTREITSFDSSVVMPFTCWILIPRFPESSAMML